MTCYNRRDKTIECLKSLFSSNVLDEVKYDVFLVDDGSKDGTSGAVRSAYPQVDVFIGDGNLFWAGGMRIAWNRAVVSNIEYDYYLLLNDDTMVFDNFSDTMLDNVRQIGLSQFILVGNIIDPKTKDISYGGKRLLTPLFLVLLIVEFTDLLFAVDSIPAIFAVTKDPYIVFFSNIFAIMGLRSMFFLLVNIIHKFHYLKTGLAFLLTFIGVKMLAHSYLEKWGFTTEHSLIVILGILVISVVASLIFPKKAAHK
ncbi:MAG: glycosyltransferase, partial [Chitinophagaceae bacterium]